jgi:hypothetical protein
VETSNAYDSELAKPGMRRTYSEETDLDDTGKSSSGDESWSGMSDNAKTSKEQGRTKLSGDAGIFVPQQSVQSSSEKQSGSHVDRPEKAARTRLSSGASVFVPGQMTSQQMAPTYAPQMSQTPMFMPQMMPMEQAMPYMNPWYYMAPDGSTWGTCPVAMPVTSGATPPLLPDEALQAPAEPQQAMEPETPQKDPVKNSPSTGSPKSGSLHGSSKTRWADLDDEDDSDDPWLSQ